jgi:dTDP-4-amino-4,6-dideoxygalactose transaminase
MNIQFVDLKRQIKMHGDEFINPVLEIIEKADFIGGKIVEEFESEFAKFCGKKYCVGLNSGTDALEFALLAYKIKDGEIITAPNSYFSSAMVISKVGAKPVFVDVDEETFNLDIKKIEKAINSKTRAIIPVHLCGQAADLDPIYKLAKKHNLIVIEDCCQAHGAEYKGQKVPIGETGAFSFYPGKNLGSFGDSGALVTDNKEIADYVRLLRNDGSKKKYYHEIIGFKSRLDAIQAAVLKAKLKHLNNWNESRRRNAQLYNKLLKGIIKTPKETDYAKHVYHLYMIQSDKRDELQKFLAEKEISTVIHYPVPIHLQEAYKNLGYSTGDFPVTEKLSKTILSIPMFPELKEEEIKYIVDVIKEFQKKN